MMGSRTHPFFFVPAAAAPVAFLGAILIKSWSKGKRNEVVEGQEARPAKRAFLIPGGEKCESNEGRAFSHILCLFFTKSTKSRLRDL